MESSSSTKDPMAHHGETPSFWQTAKSFFFPSPITHQNVAKSQHKTSKIDETRRISQVDKMYMYSFGSINMP